MLRREWLGIAALLLVVAGSAIWLVNRQLNSRATEAGRPIAVVRSDIQELALQPVPEGPTLEFASTPLHGSWTGDNLPLSSVIDAIPIPLPGTESQGSCGLGGDLIVTLRGGRRVVYGPCRHPAAILVLWSRMVTQASGGACQDGCAPKQ